MSKSVLPQRHEFHDVSVPSTQYDLQRPSEQLIATLDILHEIDRELDGNFVTVNTYVVYGDRAAELSSSSNGIYHRSAPSRNSQDEMAFIQKFTQSSLALEQVKPVLPWVKDVTRKQRRVEGFDVSNYSDLAIQTVAQILDGDSKTGQGHFYAISRTGKKILTPGLNWEHYNSCGDLDILVRMSRDDKKTLSVVYRPARMEGNRLYTGRDVKADLRELCEKKIEAWFCAEEVGKGEGTAIQLGSTNGITAQVPVGGIDNTLTEEIFIDNPYYIAIARQVIKKRMPDDYRNFISATCILTVVALNWLKEHDEIYVTLPKGAQILRENIERVQVKYGVHIVVNDNASV